MKYIRLYEFHPGAKIAQETILQFVDRAKKKGISHGMSKNAIAIYVDFMNGREIPEIRTGSKLADALMNIEECVFTLADDGYPIDWITRELLNFA